MKWDYADLSHTVKEAGGPEKYIETLEKYNFQKGIESGKKEQGTMMLIAYAAGGVTLYVISRLYKHFNNKKPKKPIITDAEAAEAKEKFIKIMNEESNVEPQSTDADGHLEDS
jgi:hypothetical protein